jgi:hypothetical protein
VRENRNSKHEIRNFVPHQIDDDSGVGRQIVARDVNGDGKVDIVTGNKKGAFVFVREAP